MAMCPHCHQMDKNFFAPQCHNCNEYTGFLFQCVFSLVMSVAYVVFTLGGMYLIFKLIFG